MKNVLVTGGTGFIGKPLIEKLLENNDCNIYILSRTPLKIRGVKLIEGDLTNKASLKIPEGIDTVFHLAGLTNSDKRGKEAFEDFMKINFEGTKNLADLLTKIKVRKFIFMSSVDALGIIQGHELNENSKSRAKAPYDVSKLKAEEYLLRLNKEKNFPVIILRPTMVYGEGDLVSSMKVNVAVYKICKTIKKHMFPLIGNGKNLLPLVYVDSVVQGTLLAEKKGRIGEIYILGDERSYALNELVKTIAEIEKVKFWGLHVPKLIMKLGASFFETLEKLTTIKAPIKISGIDYITQNRRFSIAKSKKELGYKPLNLEQGLRKTIKGFKDKDLL